MNTKPGILLKIAGWISVILMFIGSFFKLMFWPGANLAITLGALIFMGIYLPSWFVTLWKEGERKSFLFFKAFALFISALFYLFKLQLWPGSAVITTAWVYFMLCSAFPTALVLLFKYGKKSHYYFNLIVVFIFCGSLVIGWMSRASRGTNDSMNDFARSTKKIENSIVTIQQRNAQLYTAFNKLDSLNLNSFHLKALALKNFADSTFLYVKKLQSFLIAKAENITTQQADTFSILHVRDKASLNSHGILCGNELNLNKGKYSGKELKSKIDIFRDSVVEYTESENKEFIKSGINLSTEPVINDHGVPTDWVVENFCNENLTMVLTTLITLQFEIKNAESSVLGDLLNSASKSAGGNVAVLINDLGQQIEKQKREKEIGLLEKDKELFDLRLSEKNMEIEKQNQTIAWFVFFMTLVVFMVFFIVKSNLTRKKTNKLLSAQKVEIELKNKEITDSINYAKRIQEAILPPIEEIQKAFPDSFILFQPKDVVSGDFFGFFESGNKKIILAADCTGHGVPGALMSMVGNEQLTKIIQERNITKPSFILDELHSGVRSALKQDSIYNDTRDGMDIALLSIEYSDSTNQNCIVEYSGANRPFWKIFSGVLTETKADKQPIGGLNADYRKAFTNHSFTLQKGHCIYLFSDGYADQFGGEKGKKFMLKNLERLLLEISALPMIDQKKQLAKRFADWRSNQEQVDDVLIIGIRI